MVPLIRDAFDGVILSPDWTAAPSLISPDGDQDFTTSGTVYLSKILWETSGKLSVTADVSGCANGPGTKFFQGICGTYDHTDIMVFPTVSGFDVRIYQRNYTGAQYHTPAKNFGVQDVLGNQYCQFPVADPTNLTVEIEYDGESRAELIFIDGELKSSTYGGVSPVLPITELRLGNIDGIIKGNIRYKSFEFGPLIRESRPVVIAAGQSNMVGASGVAFDPVLDAPPRHYWINCDYDHAPDYASGLTLNKTDYASASIGTSFLKYRDWCGSTPFIVDGAINGTGFVGGGGVWAPGQLRRAQLLNTIRETLRAIPGSYPVSFLWHQGESDAESGVSATDYRAYLESLIADVRLAANHPLLPVVIGELAPDWTGSGKAAINDGLSQVAATGKRIVWARSTGLHSLTIDDGIHFNSASQREYGWRYSEAFGGSV